MEILLHGIELLKRDSDTNRRLAILSIDNAVELMIKTFLGLPHRVTGIKLSKKDYEELSQSFPRLLDAVHELAPDKLRDYDISEIEWFHRLRNELYHQGNGLTVERQKVVAYAEIARGIFHQLFGRDLPMTHESADSKSSLHAAITRRGVEPFCDSTKAWFFVNSDGRGYLAATANAKGSCSLRIFDAETGEFLKKQYSRGNYQEAFRDFLSGSTKLRVRSQPNLERDCRPQLPTNILHELKGQFQPRKS
ncbi:MAG: uncharacterized protein JWN74_1245 [Acidobacteriaceae bacterium]|nr:uncharacterized protein [Acidobacteriaceae bacterium]